MMYFWTSAIYLGILEVANYALCVSSFLEFEK